MKEKTSKQWKCLRNALKIATKNIDAFIMVATIAQKVKLLSNNNTPYCSSFYCFVIIMSFVLIQQNAHCHAFTNYYHNRRIFDQDGCTSYYYS